ncbi:MAG TPA: hypothetical protein VFV74_08520, partial [Burkholderiales bacterium]|nr:hypothetical protein [Burkholderiales bacterium]
FHRDSSFANFRGQLSIPPDSPRLATLLARHPGRVRTLGRALTLVDGRPRDDVVQLYDQTFVRIGYRVDPRDCFTVAWRPRTDDLLSRAANRLAGSLPSHEPLSAVSCALVPTPIDLAVAETERRVSELFDRIERACPRLLRGQTAVTEPLLEGWSRNYNGLDARLESFGERIVLNFYQAHRFVDLGKLPQWEGSQVFRPPACGGPPL